MKDRQVLFVAAGVDHGLSSHRSAFSLVEVVLALGVVSFAIVAILGILPTGLQTGKSSQDETRATQLAQSVLATMASQAPTQFNNVQLELNDGSPVQFDLSGSEPKPPFYADNDGKMIGAPAGASYKIAVTTNGAPPGFDPGNANQVTVRVSWPANAPPAAQTSRDYVRIISKF